MKNILIALIFLFALSQCQKDNVSAEISANLNQEFNLHVDQKVKLFDSNAALPSFKLKLVEGYDGTCPEGMNCLLQGSARVKIGKEENNYINPLELCLGDCGNEDRTITNDSVTFTYGTQQYLMIMKGVNSKKKKFSQKFKSAKLVVQKL